MDIFTGHDLDGDGDTDLVVRHSLRPRPAVTLPSTATDSLVILGFCSQPFIVAAGAVFATSTIGFLWVGVLSLVPPIMAGAYLLRERYLNARFAAHSTSKQFDLSKPVAGGCPLAAARRIDYQAFNQVRNGMALRQVVALLGEHGVCYDKRLVGDSVVEGWKWNSACGFKCEVVLHEGIVVQKMTDYQPE